MSDPKTPTRAQVEYVTPEERAAHVLANISKIRSDFSREFITREITAAEEYLRDQMRGLDAIVVAERAKVAALQRFKDYCHKRMDDAGIPSDPESPHRAEGCRIGGRFDVLIAELDVARERVEELEATLRPFAEEAAMWTGTNHLPDNEPVFTGGDDMLPHDDCECGCGRPTTARFTLGDLRRARALLAPAAKEAVCTLADEDMIECHEASYLTRDRWCAHCRDTVPAPTTPPLASKCDCNGVTEFCDDCEHEFKQRCAPLAEGTGERCRDCHGSGVEQRPNGNGGSALYPCFACTPAPAEAKEET